MDDRKNEKGEGHWHIINITVKTRKIRPYRYVFNI